MSLKKILHQHIRLSFPDVVSLDYIHWIAKKELHKESYCERILRKSESPEIETVYNDKKQVIGYRWRTNKQSTSNVLSDASELPVSDENQKVDIISTSSKKIITRQLC